MSWASDGCETDAGGLLQRMRDAYACDKWFDDEKNTAQPPTAEAASYPHYLGRGRHKSLQRGDMSGKTCIQAAEEPFHITTL